MQLFITLSNVNLVLAFEMTFSKDSKPTVAHVTSQRVDQAVDITPFTEQPAIKTEPAD